MIIEPGPPAHWQDLQNAVGRILAEAGFVVEIDRPVELVRGQASVDVFACDDSRKPRITYLVECKHWKSAVPQTVVHSFQTIVAASGANQGTLREFVDSLIAHGRRAIRQFDKVFGERA